VTESVKLLKLRRGQRQLQLQQEGRGNGRPVYRRHDGVIAAEEEEEEEGEEEESQGGFRSLSTTSSASSLGVRLAQHQRHHNQHRQEDTSGHKLFPATVEALATPQWKQRSEAFRAMLRRNRAISQAEQEGRCVRVCVGSGAWLGLG
jgi:hypothetical protein